MGINWPFGANRTAAVESTEEGTIETQKEETASSVKGTAKKDFGLVVIGGAAVDITAKVGEDFLKEHGLSHGHGIKTKAKKTDKILQAMGNETTLSAGGGAANSAATFAALGGKAAFQGVVGKDKHGKVFKKSLKDVGIDATALKKSDRKTTVILVPITPDNERSFASHAGAYKDLSKKTIDKKQIANSDSVYVEAYNVSESENGYAACIKALKTAKKNNTESFLNLSDANVIRNYAEEIAALIDAADFVIMNKDEAITLEGTNTVEEAIKSLAEKGIKGIVTAGENGAYVLNDEGRTIEHFKVQKLNSSEIVNHNGAGDAFAGGYLYGRLNGYCNQKAVKLGAAAAREILKTNGARPTKSFEHLRLS